MQTPAVLGSARQALPAGGHAPRLRTADVTPCSLTDGPVVPLTRGFPGRGWRAPGPFHAWAVRRLSSSFSHSRAGGEAAVGGGEERPGGRGIVTSVVLCARAAVRPPPPAAPPPRDPSTARRSLGRTRRENAPAGAGAALCLCGSVCQTARVTLGSSVPSLVS